MQPVEPAIRRRRKIGDLASSHITDKADIHYDRLSVMMRRAILGHAEGEHLNHYDDGLAGE